MNGRRESLVNDVNSIYTHAAGTVVFRLIIPEQFHVDPPLVASY